MLTPAEVHRLSRVGCLLTGRVVRHGAAAASIPRRGHAVTASVMATAREWTISIGVGKNGKITVETADVGASRASSSAPAAVPPPPECFSSAYFEMGAFRKPPDRAFEWFYNGSAEPRPGYYMSIWRGAENMTYGVNDCGLPPYIFGTSHVGSPGSLDHADINSSAQCTFGYDQTNVVDWGALPNDVLAVTCTRTIVDVPCTLASVCTHTSDVRFNTQMPWFVADELPEEAATELCNLPAPSSSPSDPTTPFAGFDLMGTSAHEFGHVWGLGHVTEEADPRMTMSPQGGLCDFSARLLGRGDHAGMCNRWCLVETRKADD